MADFTGINTTAFTATYDSINDKVDVVDAIDYAGQGFIRSDADIIFFAAYRASSGAVERVTTITPDTTVATTVSDWDDDLSGGSKDGWYEYAIVYAFDFAETGGTHQFGDVVRDSGKYYIYTSSTTSAAALTDTTVWDELSFSNYQNAKIEVLADLFVTRDSVKCVFDAKINFIRNFDCSCPVQLDCKGIIKKEALLATAQGFWNKGSKEEGQKNIETLNSICCG